ncbi:MAG: hypothetical protein ACRECH_05870 [Nitrososphaerales archaeon]
MHSKRTLLLALAVLVLVVPFGTAAAYSPQYASGHPPKSGSQAVNLSLAGGVLDAGRQTYELGGGQVVAAFFNGSAITDARVQYFLTARVSGLSTSGYAGFVLSGTTAEDQQINIVGYGKVVNSVPVVELPLNSTGGSCTIGCTSEIPAMFVVATQVTVWVEGHEVQSGMLPIGIESAYLNPFGGPIVITSMNDPTIFIMAKYTQATIQWSNVQMGGYAGGEIGTNQVGGQFSMNVNSFENLVTGKEHDRGTLSLMLGQQVFTGRFHGISVVPTAGAYDCSATTGFPCTMTGLNSTGAMNLFGSGLHIRGSYHTIWSIPAIGFSSTVSATATPMHHSDNQVRQDSDN